MVLELNGEDVVDENLVRLLMLIKEKGALRSAAIELGLPYSRAWEMLARAENVLGSKLVLFRRGGKGGGQAQLTRLAEHILAEYEDAYARLARCVGAEAPHRRSGRPSGPSLAVAASHDPLIELVAEKLSDSGYRVDVAFVGSGLALAMLSLGEVQVACSHLLDPEQGTYNRAYLEMLWVKDHKLLGGYQRQIVLAFRRGVRYNSLEEAILDMAKGRLRVVGRNRGSGTSMLLEFLLKKVASNTRLTLYKKVAYTHDEAARLLALGKADVALMLRAAAERYGLEWIEVRWERYECYTRRVFAEGAAVRLFRETIRSGWFRELISSNPGYRPLII